jgi:hypothetical protein
MRTIPVVLAALLSTTPVLAAQTIVGTWAGSKADCGKPDERTVIGPMSIDSYFRCDFTRVKRRGNTVTWDGYCYGPEGDRRPQTGIDTSAMTARLNNGKLTLEGQGLGLGPLVRCK